MKSVAFMPGENAHPGPFPTFPAIVNRRNHLPKIRLSCVVGAAAPFGTRPSRRSGTSAPHPRPRSAVEDVETHVLLPVRTAAPPQDSADFLRERQQILDRARSLGRDRRTLPARRGGRPPVWKPAPSIRTEDLSVAPQRLVHERVPRGGHSPRMTSSDVRDFQHPLRNRRMIFFRNPRPRSCRSGMRDTQKAPASLARSRGSLAGTAQTEAEGLEPPKAFARRISSAVPYQLDYASPNTDIQSGRPDLNRRPLAPEASALPG